MKNNRLHHSVLILSILFLSSCLPLQTVAPTPVTANPGEVLFQDEFDNNTTGWARVANDGGIMDYDSGGYRILVRLPKLNFWSTPGKNFRDVRVEADVTKLNGPEENRAGLICRYQSGNYYFFVISSDGFYTIGKFIGGNTILLGQSEMMASPLIQMGASLNHLRADCIGNTLTFYINYTSVASALDADLPSGDIGVLAGAFSQPGVDVLFDHFVVIQP